MSYNNIINYIDICSNALLAIIDNDECIIEKIDDKDNIYIDNNFKKIFYFYIKTFINDKFSYGKQNIIINSCKPYENFRQIENDNKITLPKYNLTDKQYFNIDLQCLEGYLDKVWDKLKNDDMLGKFIFLSNNRVDIVDMINIMRQYISYLSIDKCHYFMLEDTNNEYLHYNNIDKDILLEVETELRRKEIIL